MKTRHTSSVEEGSARAAAKTYPAFSLVELLIAVTLMTVIVLGLMAMFNQTQRAFRLGMNQTDILESGRLATDMIVREIEQARPAGQPFGTAPNFFVELTNRTTQPLPGNPTQPQRTNYMDDVFFLQRENQTWTGIGYFVRTNNGSIPGGVGEVGTLYRFEISANVAAMPGQVGLMNGLSNFYSAFNLARAGQNTNRVSRLLDGVVHFQIRTFVIDTNREDTTSVEQVAPDCPIFPRNVPTYTSIIFFRNAVPASVELELGILEQQTLERYRSIPVATARRNFFTDQAGHEHVFRQQISIRNVDPSAYRQ